MHLAIAAVVLVIGFVIAYLLGSVNFAIIITSLFKKGDIRDYGSGNAGMTNVLRTVGKTAAALTLVGDFLKGIIAVLIMRALMNAFVFGGGSGGFWSIFAQAEIFSDYIAIYGALLGHVFPIFYKFKGGKGILVSFGAIVILSPPAAAVCLVTFIIVVVFTKYVSLGSIIAAVVFSIAIAASNLIFQNTLTYEVLMALPVSAMIIFMHRANIKRLLNHNENKISFKKAE